MVQQPTGGGEESEGDGRRPRRGWRRALRLGCLACLLGLCAACGVLTVLLQAGPLSIGLPGGTALRIGSENTVVSNYSFQDGTTYFVDLSGNGVRNILEIRKLDDAHKVEIVLHWATQSDMQERTLAAFNLP